MKSIIDLFGAFGIVSIILGVILLIFSLLLIEFYGLYLAFKVSIVLGVLALLVEPSPLILGILGLFGHPEVAQKIATWLGL